MPDIEIQLLKFEIVYLKATKRWTNNSGRRRQKTRTFSQVINPWNQIRGVPKTREQILEELKDERDDWMKEEEQ